MLRLFLTIVRRDLSLALRQPSDLLHTLVFFVIVVAMFPLAIGASTPLLRDLAPAIVWISGLLASTLSIGRLFESDYMDGSLEQMTLASESLSIIVLAKVAAHWLSTGFLLVLASPAVALMFDVPPMSARALAVGLLIGTPIFSLVGAIGSALTLGLRGGRILAIILLLPLYVPVLIFGATSTQAENTVVSLLLLGAGLATALALTPWVAATAVRIALE